MNKQSKKSHSDLFLQEEASPSAGELSLFDSEHHHLSKVTRHKAGDRILITNGKGSLFTTEITAIEKSATQLQVIEHQLLPNPLSRFRIAIPLLKNPSRMEFALEKTIELGFTQIIIYESQRSVAKGLKVARWNKIAAAAMKQSLHTYLPIVDTASSFDELLQTDAIPVIFDMDAEKNIDTFHFTKEKNYLLIFGPEGGLTGEEIAAVSDGSRIFLTAGRLRAETAVVTAASIIAVRYAE